MDRLGPNLNEVFKLSNKIFPWETIARIVIEMITRLEELHSCGYLHRDIKPDNFCLGGSRLEEIYIIDFGLSIKYVDSEGRHLPLVKGKGFVGTPRYGSCNSHNGVL